MATTARIAMNKIYPASIYARPALAPLSLGVGGTVGMNQVNLNNMYRYTLQQMAVSPFSVNSEEYMRRIRSAYGYEDNGMYDAMGVVGGVVGAGIGAMYSAGVVKEGIWKGILTDNFSLTSPKTWFDEASYQKPFQKPTFQSPIYRDDKGNLVALGSKRQQTSEAFRQHQQSFNKFIKDKQTLIDKYNNSYKGYNKAKTEYNKLLNTNSKLKKLDEQYKALSNLTAGSDEYNKVLSEIATLETDTTLKNLYKEQQTKLKTTKADFDINTKAVAEAADEAVSKALAEGASEAAVKGAAEVGQLAGKTAIKAASSVMSWAGTAMDTISYGTNIVGAYNAYKDEDWVNMILYALAAQGDEMSIAGDILQAIPTPVTGIIGTIANIVGTAQSALMGLILGYRMGETVGHSLTPEGMKAQQLFTQNLYGSIVNRPLTSIATVLTTVGVPALLNRMSSVQPTDWFKKGLQQTGQFLTHNAWGNYVRSATTMMATQGINALTTKVEDTWNPPEEASDVNFVTAFSLVGDLNDNLFGATMNKATLLGLAKGDPKAQTEALARAWGYSNEDIYYNPSFDDIRDAAGINLGNVGNSIISTIGEILVDPQNRSEIADKISTERTAKEGAAAGAKNLIVTKAKLISEQTPTVDNVHTRLLLHTTEDGYIIKKVKFNSETNKYEKITNANESLPTVEICKDASDIYYNVSGEQPADIAKDVIKDGVNIKTDIEKAYEESDYESTYLNNLTSDALEQELYNYYSNYLTNGEDGVRNYYIAQQARFKKGSKYVTENVADRNFINNMCEFIKDTYITTPTTKVNTVTLRQQLEAESKNNPNEFKTKFNSLYKYYGVENTTDLLSALVKDFNLYVSKSDVNKLYVEHEHFHTQMDMIDNAMKVINKIANPLLTLTEFSHKQLQDMVTFSRNKTDPKHTAKMIVEIEEVLNGFTTADIEKAKKEIDEYAKKYVFDDDQFVDEVEQNETVKVHTALLDDTNKHFDKLVKELKQDIDTINKQKSNRIYKDYSLVDRANNNREVIHITKDNAKDIYNKIKELSQKESLNPLEKKTLREYTEAYTAYIQSDELDAIRIEYLKQVLHISETMNRMGTEASKVFMTIVQNFSKFTSYITKQVSDEKINDYLNMLSTDFNIVITDDEANIETVDSKKLLKKVTPTRGKNLRMYYKVDFAEYICTLINNELSSLYGSTTTDVIGVNDVTTVRQLLGKHINFSTWENHKNKKETIRSIIGILAKDSSTLRAGVLEDTCIDYILDMLRKHSGNKTEIIISKGLNDVDSNFLKRVIAHQLINNNETFKNLFTTMQKNLDNLDKLLNVAGEAYKTEAFSFKTVLQKHLQESLQYVLKQNPIFDLINDYAYSSGNYNSTTISLLPTYRSLFPILGKATTEKLIKGKLSYDECIKAHMTIASAEGIQKIEEVFQSTDYAKQYMSKQEPEATETSINVIPQDPNGVPQTSRMDSEEFLEFLKRNEEDIQTALQEHELREAANKEAHLDKNKKSRTVTSKYHINKRNKVTDDKYTVEEVLESLVTDGYNTMHISNDGYLEFVITPTYFIKGDTSKSFSYWIHNKDTSKVPGYKDEVEYFVDKLFREMQFSKGALKLRYKNATYTYDGKILRKGNKEVDTLTQLKKDLVKSYMSYTDKGGIKLIYNKTETLKDSKFVMHRTATYYKRCVLAGLLKTLAIGLRNGTLKDIPEYNNHKPVYTDEKSYIEELKKYIKYLRNTNSPLLDEYNKYAMSLYKEACAEAEKRLVNDEGIEINRTLNNLVRRLENFEESTIHGRSLNRPVVATDYVKRTISVDPYYRNIVKDFAHDTSETSFVKMLQLLDEYFVESSTRSLPFKAKDYDSVRMIEDSETHQRTFMFKIKNSDEEVSLIELIMEYHITRPQLEALMSNTIPNAQNKDVLHTYISDEYTKWCETFVKPVSEEDFINMVESKLDINDPNYDKKSAELKAEASKAYKILYENIDYRALITGLALNYRKTHKEELTPVKHFKERYNKETFKILEKVQNESEYEKYGCKNIYERYLVEVLKLENNDLKKHLLNHVFFTDYKEAQSIFSEQHVESLELQIDILKNTKNVDETWRKAQIDSLNTYKNYCETNHLYGKKNKETLISEILKVKTDEEIKEVLKAYNNVQKISNTKLYIPIKTNNEYKLVGVNTAKMFEQIKKGAGRLNPTIIGRFHDKFELNKGCKAINEFTYNDGYNHTLVITDSIYDSNGNFIQSEYDKIKETYKNSKELYVLTKQQYLELQEMYDKSEIVSYTETELTFKSNVKDPEKIEVKFIDNRINVKAHRTTAAFIEDLNNIKPYIKDNNFEPLYEYVNTYNKYPMWLNSYIDNIQFTQTNKYKRLKHNMAVTEVFFEMTDAFKDMDINYDLLGEFFTNDYIKDGKAINKESVSYRQLKDKKFTNGTTAADMLDFVIEALHDKYKDSDLVFNYSYVLDTTTVNTLFKLQNYMQVVLKQASLARHQGSLLMKFYKKFTNKDLQKLNADFIQDEQEYNASIWNELKGTTIEEKIQSLKDKYKKEHTDIDNEYIERLNKQNQDRDAIKNNSLNFTTTHAIIKALEKHEKPLFKVQDNSDGTFDIVDINPLFYEAFNDSTDLYVLVNTLKANHTNDEVYNIIYKEIIRPFIQNIAVNFKTTTTKGLMYDINKTEEMNMVFGALLGKSISDEDPRVKIINGDYNTAYMYMYKDQLKTVNELIQQVQSNPIKSIDTTFIQKYLQAVKNFKAAARAPYNEAEVKSKLKIFNEKLTTLQNATKKNTSELDGYASMPWIVAQMFMTFDNFKANAITGLINNHVVGLLSVLDIDTIINTNKYKEQVEKFRKDNNLNPTVFKQKTKVDSTDYNYYNYATDDLKRGTILMYAEGLSRQDQKDVQTISNRFSITNNITLDEDYVNNLLRSISTTLTSPISKVTQEQKIDDANKQFLKKHDIRNKDALHKHFYEHCKESVTREQYELAIRINSLDSEYRRLLYTAADTTILKGVSQELTDAYTQLSQSLSGDNKIDLINRLVLDASKVFKYYKYIFHKDQPKEFTSERQMVTAINSNVFNISPRFKKQTKIDFGTFKFGNNIKTELQKMWKESDTLSVFYDKLIANKVITNKQEVLYTILVTLNHYKQIYFDNFRKAYPDMETWIDAFYRLELGERSRYAKDLQALDFILGQGIDDGKHIQTDIHRPVKRLQKITRTVQALNNDLAKVIVDNEPSYVKNADAQYIIYKENDFTTTLRKIQSYTTRSLFASDDAIKKDLSIAQDINRITHSEQLDLAQEFTAKNIDECSKIQPAFHEIRTKFTDIMKKILGTNFKKGQFVRVHNVAEAIRYISEQPLLKGFYEKQFEYFLTTYGVNESDVEDLIKTTSAHFVNTSYLVNLNTGHVRSIIGYIYYTRYCKTPENVRKKDIKQYAAQAAEQQIYYEQRTRQDDTARVYKIANATNITEEQRVSQIANILYGTDNPSKDQLETVESIVYCYKEIAVTLLQARNLIDTHELNVRENIMDDAYIERNLLEVQKVFTSNIERLNEKIQTYNNSINTYKRTERKLKFIQNNNIYESPFRFTTADKAKEIQGNVEAQIDHIKYCIHVNNDNIEKRKNKLNENRNTMVLKFVRDPKNLDIITNKNTEYEKHNSEKLKPIKDDITNKEKQLPKCTPEMLSKYKDALIYMIQERTMYELISTFRNDTEALKDFNEDDVNTFKAHMKALDAVEELYPKRSQDLKELYRSEYYLSKQLTLYKNINWNNVKVTDEYEMKVANSIFDSFVDYISTSKHKINKSVWENFRKSLTAGEKAFATEGMIKVTKQMNKKAFINSIQNCNNAYKDIKGFSVYTNKTEYETKIEFSGLDVKDDKQLQQVRQNLNSINRSLLDSKVHYEAIIKDCDTRKKELHPGKPDINKDDLRKYIKDEYIKDLDKYKAKEKMEYLIKLSVKEGKDFKEYLKVPEDDLITYAYYKYKRVVYESALKRIKEVLPKFEKNLKVFEETYTRHVNLQTSVSSLDTRQTQLIDILTSKYNTDVIEHNKDIINTPVDKLYVNDEELKKLREANKEYYNALDHNRKLKNQIQGFINVEDDLKTTTEALQAVQAQKIEEAKKFKELCKRLNNKKTNMKNFDLHKQFFTNTKSVEDVIEHAKSHGIIENIEGDEALHNPEVDCIITAYNYLYMQGAINKNYKINLDKVSDFIVLDIETARDLQNNPKPYQITFIKIHKEGTKLKFDVNTIHLNHYAFFDGTVDNPGPCLKQFIEQQADMYKDENLTEAELKKRVQKIIDQVQYRKNSLPKYRMLLENLYRTSLPIVAHNGDKFDFKVLDDYMYKNSLHLLRDIYIDNITNIDFKKYRTELIENKITVNKYIEIITEPLKVLEEKYHRGEIFSSDVLESVKNLVQRTLHEVAETAIKQDVITILKDRFTGNENPLYTGNKFDKLQQDFYIYYEDPSKLDSILVDYPEKEDQVRKLFEQIKEQLNTDIERDTSVVTKATNEILEKLFKDKDPITFNAEVYTKNIYEELKYYKDMLAKLQDNPDEATSIFNTHKQYVESIKNKIDTNKQEVENLNKEIAQIEKDIATAEESMRGIYSSIYDAMTAIRNLKLQDIPRIRTALYRDFNEYRKHVNLPMRTAQMFELNIAKAEKDIQAAYNLLVSFAEAFKNHATLMSEDAFDKGLITINSAQAKDKLIKSYEARITEIEERLNSIDVDWKQSINYVKDLAENVIVPKYREDITNKINALDDGAIKDFMKKLKYDTCEDIIKSRNSIMERMSSDSEFSKLYHNTSKLNVIQQFETNTHYYKALELISQYNENIEIDQDLELAVKQILEQEKTMLENSIALASSSQLKNYNIAYSTIPQHIAQTLSRYVKANSDLNKIITQAVSAASFHKTMGSICEYKDTDEKAYKQYLETFYKEASKHLTEEEDALLGTEYQRRYVDLKEGNDINGLTVNYNTAIYTYENNIIRISFNTEYYNELQTLIIPTDDKGKAQDISTWKIEIRYTYNTDDRKFKNPKLYRYTYDATDLINNKNKLWGNGGFISNDISTSYNHMLFQNDYDYNRNAIANVIEYAQNLEGKKDKLDAIKKNTVSKKFKTVYKYDVSLDDLVVVNLTQRVNSEFEKRLALFNFAQDTDFYLADTSQLYKDIYRRVMGNLNALKYGQYLMRLPEELGNDLIIKVTEDAIKNKGVELLKATDANMGWTFSVKDEYSIDPLFGANTNSVRSVLTSNVLYATFTPIGVNNDLFFRQGNNKDVRLEKFIYNLDDTEDAKTFETFANKQIDQELKHKKYNEKQQKEYRAQRMLEMRKNERDRYRILIEEMNGGDLDIFQLRVGQEDTLIKYEKDVLHPLGINISVAFTTDTRAFEDTILIDEDFALAMGWNEANKTWLKYGFKGAVKFVKGLKDMYGSYLVSKAPSVEDRGAYGVYLEMVCNKILEYKKLGKHKDLFDGTIFETLQVFDTHESAKDCKDLIYVVGNKLVTKYAHIKDYAKFLDGLVQGTHKLDGTEIAGSVSNGKQFIDFLKTKINKDSYFITNPVTGEKVEIKYGDENSTVFAGTLYVLMDSEHTASHMQTEAKLMNADNELLGKFVRDVEGSVEKGGMWSFVVEQSAAQKVGYDWQKGLIGGDDLVTKDLADITINVMLESGEAFNDIEDTIDKALPLEERVQKVVSTIKYKYDLSDMYVSLLQEYYYSKYRKELDPTSNVWIQRYAEASNKLKEHARDTYSGNKNIAYRTSYRRYWAARNQLLANTNLKTGEIKFPANAFNTLSKYNKKQWIKTNKVSIEDVNKLLEDYADQYNKPEKYIINVDNNGDVKVYIKVSDTESKLDDTNISRAEIYRRLRFLGFLDDDNFKDIDKHKITREIQGAEHTMSIDKLTLKDINKLTQTIAYVAGIRSPVQDHNATPILKITGVVEHGAIEGNAAMYAIMGGDNDGDTAAFLAVKHEEVTNGVFKNLDTSKQSYYDKDYLDVLKGDLVPDADKLNTLNYYKQASTKYAYIGKNTSEFTTLRIKDGIVSEGKARRIRKGDAHYTYLEMLASADPTLINKLIKIYEENKDFEINTDKLSASEQDELFWVESHVWIEGKPVDEDLFTNKETMTAYIKEHEDKINLYKRLEYFLNNTIQGKEFIQEHYIEMVEAAHFATLVRGHVSKVNVGITGGLRKDINLGTYLSIFPNMNKSIWSNKREDIVAQQNELWNKEYGIDDVEKLTINELAEKVLDKTKIFEWSLDELKNISNIKELSTHSGSLDFDIISKTIIEFVTEYKLMERVLPKLIKFTTSDTPTYDMLYDVLKEESEYLLEPALSIYKYAETHKDEVVNDVIINIIKTYYCSRFVKEYNKRTSKVKTDEDIKQITEQYLKEFRTQYLLTRVTSKELNDTIQKAISLSKHGSSLGDYTKVHEQLKANAEALKEKLAKNKFACGNSDHHRRFIAMGFEYDIFERENIKFQVDDKIKEARKEATKENNRHLVLDRNDLKGTLTSAIKAIINNNMFNCYVDDIKVATEHYETFAKLLSKSVLKNNKTMFNIHNLTADEIKQLKQAIAYFELYNVSMYKVIDATYNIITKIRDAKQMGPVSVDSAYEHLVGILSFVGVNKERLLQTAGTNPDAVYIINFLTEKNNPITDAAKMLDDSIDDDTVQSLKPEVYSSMDEFEALANNVNVKEYGYPTADKITDEATKKYINDLNLIPLSHMVNGEGVIQGVLEQIFRAYNVYTNQLTTRDNIKASQDINHVQYNIIKDRVTDYEHIKKFTDNATKATRRLETKKAELKELQHKLNKTKSELQEKNVQLQRNNQTLLATETSSVDDTITRTKQQITELEEKHKQNILAKAKMAMLNNKESILEIITEPDSKSNIKLLDKDAVNNFENNLLVQMDSYQHPFSILVNAFRVYKNGKEDIDWNKMYKYLKDNYSSIRITEVMKAEDSEGLARKLIDYITVSDTEEYEVKRKGVTKKYKWEELTAKEQKKLLSKHNKNVRVESFDDLQELTKKSVGDIKYYLGKNTYDSLGNDINISDFITPTLKQIHIKSPKDLETLFEYIKNNDVAVGFTYLNDILSATEAAYKPYQMEGKFAHMAIAFNSFTKALMRMSTGFLVRNAVDTFEQLMSDMYQQQGLRYMMTKPHEIAKYILYGERIYDIYNIMSEERMLTISQILLANKNIEKNIDVKENLEVLERYLNTYITQGEAITNPINRIEGRLKIAKQIKERYNDPKYDRVKVANQMATFLGNIKFREYYEFYDSKEINGKVIDGLRIDATASEPTKSARKLTKMLNKQDDLSKQLLFEISAFMETNAMPDMFRQHQYKDLHIMVNTTTYNMTHVTQDQTIKEIQQEIDKVRKASITDLNSYIQTNVLKGYNTIVERTESLARVLGFVYNRELYGKTFNESVQNSLKMWFNYGQRSPLEMQLSFDIPYISFPLRSIANWRTRLLDPRYAVLMDDIIDGVYGQYADEDGQYSEYVQFMIQNGWVPVTDKLGIRMGSGAFDIYNLMRDPADQVKQRRSPILRGLQQLIETGDVAQAAKQLSTVGAVNRFAQTATLGAYNASKGTMSIPNIARITNVTFTYNQYTPYKYSYLYNNNGRAKYYENIYRDWFTKYGRMRKPTVDPVQLVKNIQWKQFIKRAQRRYR